MIVYHFKKQSLEILGLRLLKTSNFSEFFIRLRKLAHGIHKIGLDLSIGALINFHRSGNTVAHRALFFRT